MNSMFLYNAYIELSCRRARSKLKVDRVSLVNKTVAGLRLPADGPCIPLSSNWRGHGSFLTSVQFKIQELLHFLGFTDQFVRLSFLQNAPPQGAGPVPTAFHCTCCKEICRRQIPAVPHESSLVGAVKARRHHLRSIDFRTEGLLRCCTFDRLGIKIWMPAMSGIPT